MLLLGLPAGLAGLAVLKTLPETKGKGLAEFDEEEEDEEDEEYILDWNDGMNFREKINVGLVMYFLTKYFLEMCW